MTPKNWLRLVSDAKNRRMSRWRLGEIAEAVREADGVWAVQVSTIDAELIKYVDLSIVLERDRDQLARERDALAARVAELDHKASQYDSVVEALRVTDGGRYRADTLSAILTRLERMDALAAELARIRAALEPAWEADEGATAGEWTQGEADPDGIHYAGAVFTDEITAPGDPYAVIVEAARPEDARLIAAAVNAVRAAREANQ